MLVSKLADADGETTETQVWLDFSIDCGYLSLERHKGLLAGYEEVGKMLGSMITHPEKFSRYYLPPGDCLLPPCNSHPY